MHSTSHICAGGDSAIANSVAARQSWLTGPWSNCCSMSLKIASWDCGTLQWSLSTSFCQDCCCDGACESAGRYDLCNVRQEDEKETLSGRVDRSDHPRSSMRTDAAVHCILVQETCCKQRLRRRHLQLPSKLPPPGYYVNTLVCVRR